MNSFVILIFILHSTDKYLLSASSPVSWASLVAQMVKNLPALWETWVRSLGWEDPLEEGMATHSSILAWRIPMDRERSLVGYSLWGCKESDTTERLSTHPCEPDACRARHSEQNASASWFIYSNGLQSMSS